MSRPPSTPTRTAATHTHDGDSGAAPVPHRRSTRRSTIMAAVAGPVLWWVFTYVLWHTGGQPTLWLVSPSSAAPYRWVFASSVHLTVGHLAVNAAVWVAAAWFATTRLRVRPGWLVAVAAVSQLAGVAAHLTVDPRATFSYAGASPAVFAACTIAVTATMFGPHPPRWKLTAAVVAAVTGAAQLIELEAQLAGTSTTSAVAHLTGATVAAAAFWVQRHRTRRHPQRHQRA